MPYGIEGYNAQGSKIFDNGNPLAILSDTVESVNVRGGSSWLANMYEIPIKTGSFPCFQLLGTYNEIRTVKRSTTGYNYNFRTHEVVGLVKINNANLGARTFRYVTISDRLTKGTGGYGLEIWNEAGQKTYRFDEKVLKVDNIVNLNDTDTVNIPNGSWVAPLFCNDRSNEHQVYPPCIYRTTGTTWKAGIVGGTDVSTRYNSTWLVFTL